MTTVPVGLYPAPVVPFSAKSDFIADAFSEFLLYFLDNGATGF